MTATWQRACAISSGRAVSFLLLCEEQGGEREALGHDPKYAAAMFHPGHEESAGGGESRSKISLHNQVVHQGRERAREDR